MQVYGGGVGNTVFVIGKIRYAKRHCQVGNLFAYRKLLTDQSSERIRLGQYVYNRHVSEERNPFGYLNMNHHSYG